MKQFVQLQQDACHEEDDHRDLKLEQVKGEGKSDDDSNGSDEASSSDIEIIEPPAKVNEIIEILIQEVQGTTARAGKGKKRSKNDQGKREKKKAVVMIDLT